jgi:hypothetical protein
MQRRLQHRRVAAYGIACRTQPIEKTNNERIEYVQDNYNQDKSRLPYFQQDSGFFIT